MVWGDSTTVSSGAVNLLYSKTTDGGLTWSTALKLTNSVSVSSAWPSITSDKNNNIYIMYQGGAIRNLYQLKYTAFTSSWGAPTQLSYYTVDNNLYPSACDNLNDFTSPITIWRDNQNNRVAFYGVFNV